MLVKTNVGVSTCFGKLKLMVLVSISKNQIGIEIDLTRKKNFICNQFFD
jgi:hypothetical protein